MSPFVVVLTIKSAATSEIRKEKIECQTGREALSVLEHRTVGGAISGDDWIQRAGIVQTGRKPTWYLRPFTPSITGR